MLKYPEPKVVVLLNRLPWNGETVVCVASGPSAKKVDISYGRGKAKFIVVNDSWRLCPWADALYACDPQWWRLPQGKSEGPPNNEQFKGIRITQDIQCAMDFKMRRVTLFRNNNKILNKTAGLLGWAGNSGFHAVNIAVQAGASKIILVGYDMAKEDGYYHWHGRHGPGLNNPTDGSLYKWRIALDQQKEIFDKLGITVLNCSPISTLENYPKVSFVEAFDG